MDTAAPSARPQVKLVIWDLDETLWRGVLGEGQVQLTERRIGQVRELVDRGVMVSISSRNDEATARAELERHDLWGLVIFPRINWNPKGAQIRDLIEAAQLRPINVLFVDDNHLNREEATHYARGLQVADPADPDLDSRIDEIARSGKPDPGHRRLREYRHLEARASEAIQFDDNRTFLRSCRIELELRPALPGESERIHELIQRTNQLNYTKRRVDPAAIHALLSDPHVVARAIHVRDKFGDYGLVGFAAVRDGRVEHLAFSCRILGMGVERAVYQRLGRPQIAVAEPVSAPLEGDDPDWLTIVDGPAAERAPVRPGAGSSAAEDRDGWSGSATVPRSILFVGGCDLQSTIAFLERPDGVATHLNYSPPDRPRLTVHRDSIDYLLADRWPAGSQAAVLADAPFLDAGVFDVPDWQAFRHIVYSPLIDYVQAKYARPDLPGVLVSYGDVEQPDFDEDRIRRLVERGDLDEARLRRFAAEWTPVTKADDVWLDQLGELFDRMRHAETVTILLGASRTFDDLDAGRLPLHQRANALIARAAAGRPNVHLVEVDAFLHDRADFADAIRHYSRRVYRDIAESISGVVSLGVREPVPRSRPARSAARTPVARIRRQLGTGLRRLGLRG